MKILIAGAGIAGSVLARHLREAGHEAAVLDATPHLAASRCAFAYLRLDWFKGPDKEQARYALQWYDDHGWLRTSKAWVTDVRRGKDFSQPGHFMVDPRGPLVQPTVAWSLRDYHDGPGGVLATAGEGVPVEADHLVLACGAGMDRWYSGTPTYGGVFECEDYRMITPLKLLRVTDRITHVAADDGAVTRVGASKGRTPLEARERADLILERMFNAGIVTCTRKWTYRPGVRWTNLSGAGGHARISEHVWAFTGFARSGYATVPGAARSLVRALEERR